jgi:hypothetical protein
VTAEVKYGDKPIKYEIIKMDETKYDLKFLPVNVGLYHVHVYMGGQQVKGSPFTIKIEEIVNSKPLFTNPVFDGGQQKKIQQQQQQQPAPVSAVSESNLTQIASSKQVSEEEVAPVPADRKPAVAPRKTELSRNFVEARRRFSSACSLSSSSTPQRSSLSVDSERNVRVELTYLPGSGGDKNDDYTVGDEITVNGKQFNQLLLRVSII